MPREHSHERIIDLKSWSRVRESARASWALAVAWEGRSKSWHKGKVCHSFAFEFRLQAPLGACAAWHVVKPDHELEVWVKRRRTVRNNSSRRVSQSNNTLTPVSSFLSSGSPSTPSFTHVLVAGRGHNRVLVTSLRRFWLSSWKSLSLRIKQTAFLFDLLWWTFRTGNEA